MQQGGEGSPKSIDADPGFGGCDVRIGSKADIAGTIVLGTNYRDE
jgi:hypothetical protein